MGVCSASLSPVNNSGAGITYTRPVNRASTIKDVRHKRKPIHQATAGTKAIFVAGRVNVHYEGTLFYLGHSKQTIREYLSIQLLGPDRRPRIVRFTKLPQRQGKALRRHGSCASPWETHGDFLRHKSPQSSGSTVSYEKIYNIRNPGGTTPTVKHHNSKIHVR